MNVLLFGATGMVGQGVLRECLVDPSVHLVKTVGRTATGAQHAKFREVVPPRSVGLLVHRNGTVRL